ncbi:MAG TPA: glycosyltransferase [Acidimicrobiales bacterium]|nr:glycosyltransferase [Acidimicrobiales bacterium]
MTRPVVITGGGTGGHIFPMRAVAEQLERAGVEPSQLRYVGSRRGQEATLLGGGPIALTLLPGRGIRRSLRPRALWDNVGALIALAGAVCIALYKVRRWRPRVVVSLGGYASFAVGAAAVVWRCPLVLVDLDAVPGSAHRLLMRFAARRCTTFSSSDPRAVVTGVPLREAIVALARSDQRSAVRERYEPRIDPGRTVIVVMTGSLGAVKVNSATIELAKQWSQRDDLCLIHVTGRRDFQRVLAAHEPGGHLDYRILEFADMSLVWAVCDVAVCRAGAVTIGELTALAIASVLVPLPNSPGNHQMKNAETLSKVGAALVVPDDTCNATTLATALTKVLDPTVRSAMADAARSLGRLDASAAIAQVVLDVGGLG